MANNVINLSTENKMTQISQLQDKDIKIIIIAMLYI